MSERLAGLYLHVPFCARVCPYCDFAVRTGDRARRRRFVDDLVAETALWSNCGLQFDTVYFGGGTPSSLEPGELGRILQAARERLRLAVGTRVFLEVNPEDVTREAVRGWRELGVHTLSLGVQSLDRAGLAFLGRRHEPDDARRAMSLAREAGFDSVSVDLIYCLPGQRPADWRAELDRALELRPDHVSCYTLTIHERTRFGLLERRGELTQLGADVQGELFRLTHRHLNDAGLQGYEVSQFAADPRHRSKHNSKYWDHTPYLGLGPGAHSYRDARRWWNLRRTDPWQERVRARQRPIEAGETLGTAALVLESLLTGLRTYAGVDLDRLRARFDVDLAAANAPLIERLEAERLLTRPGNRLVPTLDGLAVADSLPPLFRI